eukprot:GEMP01036248.1.p1 GENE.GEMP01036248.1~~GEMP01036248.1.p1  ORF type:complete len:363 (+),score=76.91 GEMP01036248.1:74-1162(+)
MAAAAILESVKPPLEYWTSSEEVLNKIEKYVGEIFPQHVVSIRPFGSYAQRTALTGSDVDLALVFDGVQQLDNDPNDQNIATKNLKVSFLRTISEKLKKDSYTCTVLAEVFDAKVPVLKIAYTDEGDQDAYTLEVDLTIGKWTTGDADYMIGEMLDANHAVRDVYYLLKHWVKCRLAVPDKTPAFYGLLNSFSWVLLFIFHMIQEGYLVAYTKLGEETCKDLPQDGSLDAEPELDLLRSFFDYVISLNDDMLRKEKKLSTLIGKVCPRDRRDFQAMVLWIEDPSLKTNNAARCCQPPGWHVIVEECYRARQMLEADLDIDSLFEKTVVNVALLRRGGVVQTNKRSNQPSLEEQQSWKRRRHY